MVAIKTKAKKKKTVKNKSKDENKPPKQSTISTSKFVQKKLLSVKRAEYNPRKVTEKQKEEIRRSIKKFGMVEPMVINTFKGRENVLIGGHQRLTILLEEGEEVGMFSEVCLNKADEKELNIRLNKNNGEFDNELMRRFFEKDEVGGWGFGDEEMIDIWGGGVDGEGSEGEGECDNSKNGEGSSAAEKYLSESFIVEVKCADEFEQEQVFNDLQEMGLECKILTL